VSQVPATMPTAAVDPVALRAARAQCTQEERVRAMDVMDLAAFRRLPSARYTLRRGDWVAWHRGKLVAPWRAPLVVGQIVRLARDRSWADVTYPIPERERSDRALAWGITHRTARVKTAYLRKADAPPEETPPEETPPEETPPEETPLAPASPTPGSQHTEEDRSKYTGAP
jgi:hypothetical protein